MQWVKGQLMPHGNFVKHSIYKQFYLDITFSIMLLAVFYFYTLKVSMKGDGLGDNFLLKFIPISAGLNQNSGLSSWFN